MLSEQPGPIDTPSNRERQRAASVNRVDDGPDKMRAHYQYGVRVALTPEDIERGYVELSLDPYTIGELYQVGGGPREQVMKKSLRGTGKGQTEQALVDDIQSAIDRWREKLREREYLSLIRPTT